MDRRCASERDRLRCDAARRKPRTSSKTDTETCGRGVALKSSHGTVTPFDPSMVLLQPVVQIALGSMRHVVPKVVADCPRIGIMPIGRNALGRHPAQRPGRAKAGLGCHEVAGMAQPCIYKVPIPVTGTVEVTP